jgi:hypothetical protein
VVHKKYKKMLVKFIGLIVKIKVKNKSYSKIKKCLICTAEVEGVEKVRHGSGSVYKCPATDCYFSCQKSLTELLDHIKETKHFRQVIPEQISVQSSLQTPIQNPTKHSSQNSAQQQIQTYHSKSTIQGLNPNIAETKNLLQNPFQDENGQMYYK